MGGLLGPAVIAASEDLELSEGPERREALVSEAQHGQRLDKVLTQMVPEFSRSHLQSLVAKGHVQIEVQTATQASRKVKAGQRVAVELVLPDESLAFTPQALMLDVVFEDEHVLVINKPAGLVVHPAPGNWSGTLLNGLLARDPVAARLPRAGIVHRLDKDTSGLMVVARSLEAQASLVRDLQARTVHRRYMALVHGDVGNQGYSVDAPIGRDPLLRIRMAVVGSGKPARTDVAPQAYRDGISAIWCTLHTGRTHQIRVHLSHQGHPLVSDAVYGGAVALGLPRQALHARELAFVHPVGREALHFEATPPPDFQQAWDAVVSI